MSNRVMGYCQYCGEKIYELQQYLEYMGLEYESIGCAILDNPDISEDEIRAEVRHKEMPDWETERENLILHSEGL